MKLLRAPERWTNPPDELIRLLRALRSRFPWLVLDLPAGLDGVVQEMLGWSDVLLLVTTADPPALRAARRLVAALPGRARERTGLVVNQITRRHPAAPREVAASLGVKLLAWLPPDPRAVGHQVNFGHACVLDRRSALGAAIATLARRLAAMAERTGQAQEGVDRVHAGKVLG